MFDRIFSAALTFCVLAGGTLAIGSEFLAPGTRVATRQAHQVVEPPRTVVSGQPSKAAPLVARTEAEAAPRAQ